MFASTRKAMLERQAVENQPSATPAKPKPKPRKKAADK